MKMFSINKIIPIKTKTVSCNFLINKIFLSIFLCLIISSTNGQTKYEVTGAGTTAVNGVYYFVGALNGKDYFKMEGASYYLYWHEYSAGAYYWNIDNDKNDADVYYNISSTADTVPNSVWSKGGGSDPVPTVSAREITTPEISVLGNSNSIDDGSTTPSSDNDTDFGSVLISGGTKVKTFTIRNIGTESLELDGSPKVSIGGTHTADFSVTLQPTSPVAINNGSTTFQVTFNPSADGTRSASLSINNNDDNENPYTFNIEGTGIYIAPTVQASSIIFSDIGAVEMNINWTKGNGSKRAVFVKETNSGLPTPSNNTTFIANTHFKKGTQIGTSSWYCVYNGTLDSVIVNGLMPGSNYRVMVCEYNGDAGYEKYLTTESTDNASTQTMKTIIINEIDVDTPGTDSQEFIELFDGGSGNTSLDGLILVFYNGSDDQSYDISGHTNAIDLNGYMTGTNGYFVLAGNSFLGDADIRFGDNSLQNGADAIAIFADSASSFPNDTPITLSYLIDAIVYDTQDADDAGLLPLINGSEPQVNENGNGDKDNHSNQRILNGTGGLRNTSNYSQQPPTPGTRNNVLPTSANESITVEEDVIKTLALNDFTYVDADSDPLWQVQLISKPTKGSLFIDLNDDDIIDLSEELVNNDTILKTDITANRLKYIAALNEFGNNYTYFKFKVNDSLAYSSSEYTMTINVTTVNDLPTAVNDTVTTNEDTDKVFAASEFNYSDIEGSAMQQVQITLIPDNGVLFNDANTNGAIDVGEAFSNNDIVTKAHIDANRLKFKPDLNEFGAPYASFNFKVHDGTVHSNTAYKLTIDVTPVNDLPISADSMFGCPINTDHIFTILDFPYSDVEGSPISMVNIPAVPIKGSLYFDSDNDNIIDGGEAYTDGANILSATIESGKVKYKPNADENNQPYTTFTFKVNDGNSSSSDTYTMTVSVYPEFVVGSITEDMVICNNSIPNELSGLTPTGGNTPYTYQWQSSSDGINFSDITAATKLNYQPTALNDTTYFRQIQTSASNCGTRITNTVVIYTVQEFIGGLITSNQTLCYNTIPSKLVGTASTSELAPYTYQWQSSTDRIIFSDIAGETSLEYQPPSLTQTTYYQLLQSSSWGCGPVETNIVKVKVLEEFKTGSISKTQVMYYRSLPEKFIGVAPTGGSLPYTYQWQESTDGTNFSNINGADKLDYQAGRISRTAYYRLKQGSSSGCGDLITNRLILVVFPEFIVGTISKDQHIAFNTSPDKLIGKEPRGGRHPYSYQWQSSSDGLNFTDIVDETSLNYQPGILTDTTYYRQIQSAALGYADKETNVVGIFVYPEFSVGSISEDQVVCYNSAPEIMVGVEPTGGDTLYTYQWLSSTDGIYFTEIPGAISLSYQAEVLAEKTYFKQIQTSSSESESFATNVVVITIQAQPTVDCAIDEATICANESYQLAASAQNYSSVIWSSLGDGTFNAMNILNPIYTPGENDIANGAVILAINAIATSACEMLVSDEITLLFNELPIVNTGDNLTIYKNTSAQINASVQGTGSYTYLWSPASMVSDPTVLNPVTNPISETTTFALVVTDNETDCSVVDQVTFKVEPGTTYQISGKVQSIDLKNPLPATTVCFSEIDQTTTTNDQGEFSIQVPAGYSGWAIPSRAGYVFEPDSIAFNYIGTDIVDQDYGGTLYLRAIASPDSIIAGQSVQLSIEFTGSQNSVYSCKWLDENGEIGNDVIAIIEPTQTTIYTVFVEDAFERTFDTIRVYVSTTVGLNYLENSDSQISIYPNPTSGNIYMDLNEDQDASLISIFTTDGKLVREIEIQTFIRNNKIEINLANLTNGNYYVSITNKEGRLIKTLKIIKM
ncbi:MAG: choice-of-anchor D domain-containing protein [Bacteroidetes bacterium]|nr:choice-of-anchor D domain-containing protein [Bacteroidota bacterium]